MLFGFLVAVELVAVPAFVMLLLEPGVGPGAAGAARGARCWPTRGSPWSGTLVGALGVQTRARDLIIPLIALPLLVPVVIGAARGHRAVARGRWRGARSQVRWLAVLALYDAVFGLLAYAVFDFLLEE